MLRFITGRAGTGKTHLLMEQLSAAASDGETGVILVVPEQFSFAFCFAGVINWRVRML